MPFNTRSLIALSALGIVLVTGIALLARPARLSTQVGDVDIACGSSQRALVRHVAAGSTPRVEVTCVDDLGVVPSTYRESSRLVPATFRTERPAAAAPVRTVRAASPSASSSTAEREARPSWQKRALIIGGSAGAGAGIGALAGGKKGALIGAAIGGGGALVVDQIKNK
jgi:hypothetical protein